MNRRMSVFWFAFWVLVGMAVGMGGLDRKAWQWVKTVGRRSRDGYRPELVK